MKRLDLFLTQRFGPPSRVKLSSMQRFICIDVANASDQSLIEKKRLESSTVGVQKLCQFFPSKRL
jgi:hypothetical protein